MKIKHKSIAIQSEKIKLKYYAILLDKFKDNSIKIFLPLGFVSLLAKDLAVNPIKDVVFRACFGIMPSFQQLEQDTPKAYENIGKMLDLEPHNVMLIKNMLKVMLLLFAGIAHVGSQYINKKINELDKKTN